MTMYAAIMENLCTAYKRTNFSRESFKWARVR